MPHFPTTTNGSSASSSEPRRCMLVTNPRTCSNLLVRILNLDKQPHTKHGGYHFLECFFVMYGLGAVHTPPSQWTEEQKNAVWEKYRSSIEALEKTATTEESDGTRIVFTKEHVETFTNPITLVNFALEIEDDQDAASSMTWDVGNHSASSPCSPLNQTIFPDSYLLSWSPVFLIRHPVRAFESIVCSMTDVLAADERFSNAPEEVKMALISAHLTLSWTRKLWQFYESKGVPSLIIDADDLVMKPQATTQALAEWVGFDKNALQYTWTEASDNERAAKEAAMRRMLSSLDASAGVTVDPSKLAKNVGSAEEQMPKWRKEFGDVMAEKMWRSIERTMPDYEYLMERRLRP
ncbi:hypothetical protein PRZ48_013694 [Zasmidium cellare]|uniref:Sulfotransferase n=1 Tax=Zasmidium cellare TaxID=395010 RepID=A0ABR0E1S0_ZASCE|nr:hypothetical protein PRZ48_013694 [Zasmidium cellare]